MMLSIDTRFTGGGKGIEIKLLQQDTFTLAQLLKNGAIVTENHTVPILAGGCMVRHENE